MIELDRKSLLVAASADVTLGALEEALRASGLTLGLGALPPGTTVKALIEDGAVGAPAPWQDPADHLFAGLVAREVVPAGDASGAASGSGADGKPRQLVVRPVPRRAVGADRTALVVGLRGRLYEVESAWLRVHLLEGDRAVKAHPLPFSSAEPPLSPGEDALWSRIAFALTAPNS